MMVLSMVILPALPQVQAAGGGPPMITDDPGTPETGCWEINISYNTDLRPDEKEMEAPLLDINYGFNDRTQLKVEVPYLFVKEDGQGWHGKLGHVTPGIKYRFLDQERDGVSVAFYPQLAIATEEDVRNEYIFPIEIEASIGPVTLGTDIRYIYINGEDDSLQHGLLIGYELGPRLEVMAEFVYEIKGGFNQSDGVVNFGFRYEMDRWLSVIASTGTGVFQCNGNQADFISFAGVQINI